MMSRGRRREPMADKTDRSAFDKARENLNAMRGRIEEILGRLGQLAEGKDWSKEVELGDEDGKGVRGVYGFSVRVGGGAGRGPSVRVEPFGTVRRPGAGGRGEAPETNRGRSEREAQVPVREIREPLVDVIEEDGTIAIVAELPGVATEQLVWELGGDVLTLHAESGDRAYHKEILLPAACIRDGAHLSGTNGVMELRLRRSEP